MKNLRLILVLLLMVNCTADLTEVEEAPETNTAQADAQSCVDDLPQIRLTNNGTDSFDFIVYGDDYSVLHTQNISVSANSGFIELSNNNVLVVVSNNVVYGQKIPLSLVACDVIELEIDASNILIISND
jgi:hypothetical protein